MTKSTYKYIKTFVCIFSLCPLNVMLLLCEMTSNDILLYYQRDLIQQLRGTDSDLQTNIRQNLHILHADPA